MQEVKKVARQLRELRDKVKESKASAYNFTETIQQALQEQATQAATQEFARAIEHKLLRQTDLLEEANKHNTHACNFPKQVGSILASLDSAAHLQSDRAESLIGKLKYLCKSLHKGRHPNSPPFGPIERGAFKQAMQECCEAEQDNNSIEEIQHPQTTEDAIDLDKAFIQPSGDPFNGNPPHYNPSKANIANIPDLVVDQVLKKLELGIKQTLNRMEASTFLLKETQDTFKILFSDMEGHAKKFTTEFDSVINGSLKNLEVAGRQSTPPLPSAAPSTPTPRTNPHASQPTYSQIC